MNNQLSRVFIRHGLASGKRHGTPRFLPSCEAPPLNHRIQHGLGPTYARPSLKDNGLGWLSMVATHGTCVNADGMHRRKHLSMNYYLGLLVADGRGYMVRSLLMICPQLMIVGGEARAFDTRFHRGVGFWV